MAEACSYTNPHGIKCGLAPHSKDVAHELTQQLCAPSPFYISAHDPFALAIVRTWITIAKVEGVNAHKLALAEDWYYQCARWQREHGTKIPD